MLPSLSYSNVYIGCPHQTQQNHTKWAFQRLLSKALTDWQFVSELTTENVWDAFIIVFLLEDKLCACQQLHVPRTGAQKDRFKEAMAARNKDIVLNGQPDAVGHACNKCFRKYETEDGERGGFNQTCTMLLLTWPPWIRFLPSYHRRWLEYWLAMLCNFCLLWTIAE